MEGFCGTHDVTAFLLVEETAESLQMPGKIPENPHSEQSASSQAGFEFIHLWILCHFDSLCVQTCVTVKPTWSIQAEQSAAF